MIVTDTEALKELDCSDPLKFQVINILFEKRGLFLNAFVLKE